MVHPEGTFRMRHYFVERTIDVPGTQRNLCVATPDLAVPLRHDAPRYDPVELMLALPDQDIVVDMSRVTRMPVQDIWFYTHAAGLAREKGLYFGVAELNPKSLVFPEKERGTYEEMFREFCEGTRTFNRLLDGVEDHKLWVLRDGD